MFFGEAEDELRLREPLLVGAAFVVDHGGEGVELDGVFSRERIFTNSVDEIEKWRGPGLDEHDAAVLFEDAADFRESLIEVGGEGWQMMQAALHDDDVLAVIGEGQFAAVGYDALCGAGILREQAWRKVDALNAGEPQLLQGV